MTTEEHLEKLEGELTRVRRHNRRLLVGGGLLVGPMALAALCVSIVALTTHRGVKPDGWPRTQPLVLEDADSDYLAVLGATGLTLFDKNGKIRTELVAGGLRLRDDQGNPIWSAPPAQ
jgi:hypothetical protein